MAKVSRLIKRPAVIGFLVFGNILFLTQIFAGQRSELIRHQRARELTVAATAVQERIDAMFSDAMAAASSLSVMARDFGHRDFDRVARHITELHPDVDGLSLVQGEIVTHVYPLAGNEAYLGYNIFTDTVSNDEVRQSLRLKTRYFAGPFRLVQGGQGIIARMPVYRDSSYIGFATALVRLPKLLAAARLDSAANPEYQFRLSRINRRTGQEIFYGPPGEAFRPEEAIRMQVPESDWFIHAWYARPQQEQSLYFRGLGLILAIVAGFLGWLIARRPAELKRLVEEQVTRLRETEEQYATLFRQANDAIFVVDGQGRFLDANVRFCRMLQYEKEELLQMRLEDIMDQKQLQERPIQYEPVLQGALLISDRRMVRRNGQIAEVESSVKLIADNKILVIGRDVTRQREIQRQLSERMKELQCLYSLAELTNKPGITIEEVLHGFVRHIPNAYFDPEHTAIRIWYREMVFCSEGFRESEWRQEAPVLSGTQQLGYIEVHYTRAEVQEDPFKQEELYLLRAITELLGQFAERKQAQTALSQSEEKFRNLVEQSLASVFIFQDDLIKYVNPSFEKATGYERAELLDGMSLTQLVHDEDRKVLLKNYSSRMNGKPVNDHYFVRVIRRDGSPRQMEMVVATILYDGRPAVIGTVIDVTERMEEEKRIDRAVAEAQELERLHIGMELHDNVKQIVAASRYRLSALAGSIPKEAPSHPIIEELKSGLLDAIRELRRLSHQLAPSIDQGLPLADKIRALADTMNSAGTLSISIDVSESGGRLDEEAQLALYRIVQEQLVNIIKYAEATEVEIHITSEGGRVRLHIRDNGKGYDPGSAKGGIGLENIRRRARFLEGRVDISSAPGAGCTLVVEIPVTPFRG